MTSETLPSLPSPWRSRTDRAKRPILPARPVVWSLEPVARIRRRLSAPLARQVVSFAGVGIASTFAYVVLYAALRAVTSAPVANAAALLITAVGNTAANRRLTFSVQGPAGLARDHAAGLLAFAVALAITSASLSVLRVFTTSPGRGLEIAVLVAANVAATVIRFLLLRLALDRAPSFADPASERTAAR